LPKIPSSDSQVRVPRVKAAPAGDKASACLSARGEEELEREWGLPPNRNLLRSVIPLLLHINQMSNLERLHDEASRLSIQSNWLEEK